MPIRYIEKKRGGNVAAETLAQGLAGFLEGKKLRREQEKESLASVKTIAELTKLVREEEEAKLIRDRYFNGGGQGQQPIQPSQTPSINIPATGGGQPQFLPPSTLASQRSLLPQRQAQPSQTQQQSRFGLVPKTIKFGGQEFTTPESIEQELEQKRIEEAQKPLGENAPRFAGAQQGLRNIQDIIDLLEISETETGEIKTGPDFKRKILGTKAAGFRLPGLIRAIPGIGATEGLVQLGAGDVGRKLHLKFDTLSENLLRLRSGAATPEPELVREMSRTLTRLFDSPEAALERLREDEDFLSLIVESIRPGQARKVTVPRITLPKNQTQRIGKFEVLDIQ